MAVYPVIQNPAPWNNPRELGQTITVAGLEVIAVVSLDPVIGDVDLGAAGFEATQPYALVERSDIESLGDLHGATVVIDGDNYRVRNVSDKKNINLVRLWIESR